MASAANQTESSEAETGSRTMRILAAEDCAEDCTLNLAAIRRQGYTAACDLVDSLEEFQRCLAENTYDIVLTDHKMQNWSGSDALEMVRQSGKDIPVIVVTGCLGDERAVEYLKQGAADYVVKEHLERLPLAVKRALQEKASREENVRLQNAIQSAKEDWERTFEAIPDSIVLLDRECRIVRANRSSACFLNENLLALAGVNSGTITHRDEALHPDSPARRMFLSEKKETSEVAEPETGRIFSMTAIPLRNADGIIDGAVHVMSDITERKRVENAKTILLKDIHHRVKNNLAVICALLHLQARKDKNAQVRLSLEACEQRIQSIALVHEHIYRSESVDHIDFANYARQMGRQLFSALGVSEANIRLELDLSSIEVSSTVANACGLILNELITNALKYAFPDHRKGKIRVTFHATAPGLACLTVSDNGVGIPESVSLDGSGGSLGFRIVNILAKQLDGSMRVVRDHGTSIALTFRYCAAGDKEAEQ